MLFPIALAFVFQSVVDKEYVLHTAEAPWSAVETWDGLRFELRPGDTWANDVGRANKTERAEAYFKDRFKIGETYTVSFRFMLEPGAPNTADWLILAQVQSTFDVGERGHSPGIALALKGERMRIISRYSREKLSTPENTFYLRHYEDEKNLERGRWYEFDMTFRIDPFANGLLRVERNGELLVDYLGPMGFNDIRGPYLKLGLYRDADKSTLAARYSFPLRQHYGSQSAMSVALGPSSQSAKNVDAVLVAAGGKGDIWPGTAKGKLIGGQGYDTVDFSQIAKDVRAALTPSDKSRVTLNGETTLYIEGIENAIGGSGADMFSGGDGSNILLGNGGDDELKGGHGPDKLDGGAGDDTVDYSYTDKALILTLAEGAYTAPFVGSIQEDVLRDLENVIGGNGDDIVIGDDRPNRFDAGSGNDTFQGGGGVDVFGGSRGNDTASYADQVLSVSVTLASYDSARVYIGGVPDDILKNVENLIGGSGDDYLAGDENGNAILGGPGDDLLMGEGGNDLLEGGEGSDRLIGGGGNDELIGGLSKDVMIGGPGSDRMIYYSAEDSLPEDMDCLCDFTAEDRVDLSNVDANYWTSGHQRFRLTRYFTGRAGELWLYYVNNHTIAFGDMTGNRRPDFGFVIPGYISYEDAAQWTY
ncbi:putative hemolysin-adenlyate cyclase protein [Parvularcula bermudensis HTCC2503]|uniref:Putative hemolysin-adenlyate cyclase protein n=1 Tax=Parvularcula bermudensis (strain ATCC BAA-594 / HTCC2503 / KCTC 12087) TaxID=314260 RepID=E0TI80_PARBH|nr:heparin lyase I family protein [Parvularcula bermudensis]ADM09419.1 putative hemolysin-adenlyate cyclase protein [Parvularcula bermudensis HTCC2503]